MKIQFKHSSSHSSGAEENSNVTSTSSTKSLESNKKGEKSILSKLRVSCSNTIQRVRQSTMKVIGTRAHQALKDYNTKQDTTGPLEGKQEIRLVPRHENTSGPFTSNTITSSDTIYATVVHPSIPLAQRPLPPISENNPLPKAESIYAELDFTSGPNVPDKMKPVIYENLKNVSPASHTAEPIYAEIETIPNSTSVNKEEE